MPVEDAPTAESELDERELLHVLTAVRQGDFSVRMPIDRVGLPGKVADTLNEIIHLDELLVAEVRRLRREVGREGRTHRRAAVPGANGAWQACVEALNELLV